MRSQEQRYNIQKETIFRKSINYQKIKTIKLIKKENNGKIKKNIDKSEAYMIEYKQSERRG